MAYSNFYFKNIEQNYRVFIPKHTYTIIRLDGKAFHTFTKGFDKPFDKRITHAFALTLQRLTEEIPGVRYGYSQSDEISLVLTDFENPNTEQWFGGNIQKITSVAASMATLFFNLEMKTQISYNEEGDEQLQTFPFFDARVIPLETQREAVEYFLARRADCHRNAVSAAAQSYFSHKELHGVSTVEKLQYLSEHHGIDYFTKYTMAERLGWSTYKEAREETVSYQRKDTGETLSEDVTRNYTVLAAGPETFFEDTLYAKIPPRSAN